MEAGGFETFHGVFLGPMFRMGMQPMLTESIRCHAEHENEGIMR